MDKKTDEKQDMKAADKKSGNKFGKKVCLPDQKEAVGKKSGSQKVQD